MTADRPFAVIRADASPAIGGGHVMRCLALAQALATDGWHVAFAGTAETPGIVAALAAAPYDWRPLASPDDADALPDCDLLVVDHYGLDATFERAARQHARRILVLDDLADRPHDCDLLLDQTLGRAAADYTARVPPHCTVLTGSTHALLRPQFATARLTAAAIGPVRRVVLTLGTTDPARLLPGAIAALRAALPQAELVVVVGSAAPHLAEISQAAQTADAILRTDVADMAGLLAQADLAVAAAGSVTWELCALARPMILVQTAANQTGIVAAMRTARAAVISGPAELGDAARALADDDARRAELAAAAGILCDGRGARRVAMDVRPERAADGAPVTLRPATMADALMVLDWQAAPETRRFARNPAVPSEAEHLAWMARRLAAPGCLFNIVLHGGVPAGVLRLDHLAGRVPAAFEVSIFIAPSKFRLGLGRAALTLARRLAPEAVLDAQVHPDNAASRALFLGCGYQPEEDWYRHHPIAWESA